jgi:selenocysteine lyase/cysteine desulfurase
MISFSQEKQELFVGGEFYYDGCWITQTHTSLFDGMHFLNGGQACLKVISDLLLAQGITTVLLPAYLCPTIVKTFERNGIACDFYQVNRDLSLDLDDVAQKIEGHRVFYFINYFGFPSSPSVRFFIQNLQKHGILVIEDNAQAGFVENPIGDFIFNSMRKLVPYDGGYLSTKFDVTPVLQKFEGRINHRLPLIRDYRQRLYGYLFKDEDERTALSEIFLQAEHYYETDGVVLGDEGERNAIEHLDWQAIRQIRRENYSYLLDLIQTIPEIEVIHPALPEEIMPMGMPVYLNRVDRDRVHESLGEAGIGLLVHWSEINQHPLTRQNVQAVDMTDHMLTLAIDQRTSKKQLEYLAVKLAGAVAVGK